jgi:hypothetical protein
MSHYQRDRQPKLITQTGSFKKVIINMDIAKVTLNKNLLSQLNNLLVELNDIQERMDKGTTPGS